MANANRPMIRIHNSETNEIVDREMNDAEFAQHEIDLANAQAKLAETVAQAATKASAIAKLAALGLTEDEAKAILG
jgi:hypothetical protein